MLIKDFYKDQEIFITGGSGFIGKVLIEKLLRFCPDIKRIYVLLRPKKGKETRERLKEIFSLPLFDKLREERPEAFEKLHVIDGDCSEIGLGIKNEDLTEIQNVNIIFHTAACVRFDDSLKSAILLNTRGTHELVKLALNMKNLKAFLHTSTTYCNPEKKVVEEMIYPPYADWRAAIKHAEACDLETLNAFGGKYCDVHPNTYTFTKSLAEHVVNDFRDQLPVFIFRPSIVISTIADPIPGWIDNFNGPVGMLVAGGIGIFRTNYADPDTIMDFVPVDVVIQAMIISVYKEYLESSKKIERNSSDITVYNCASSDRIMPTTLDEVISLGYELIMDNPFEKTIWVPGGSITRCRYWHFLKFLVLQVLVAIVVDTGLILVKQKPRLLKLQRKISEAMAALQYFTLHSWHFKNEKFVQLQNIVPEQEVALYSNLGIASIAENLDKTEYYGNCIKGARQYLLKEGSEATPEARNRLKIFKFVHFIIKCIAVLLVSRFIIRYVYFSFSYIFF